MGTHFNDHLLCSVVIDFFDNSLDGDFYQIGIVPLNQRFDPDPTDKYPPISFYIIPRYPETINAKKKKEEATKFGLDYYESSNLFETWFRELKLGHTRQLLLLGFNICSYIPHLKSWLQESLYNEIIHPYYRDMQAASLFINDRCYAFDQVIPIAKNIRPYILAKMGITYSRSDPVLERCRQNALAYKRMVNLPILPMKELLSTPIPDEEPE